jgi:hypothetical protein
LPDLSGFDVIKLPSIEDRLAMPYSAEYSIPKVDLEGLFDLKWLYSEKLNYSNKLHVFRLDKNDWRIDVQGIAQSEFGGSFKTQTEALNKAWEYLERKGI